MKPEPCGVDLLAYTRGRARRMEENHTPTMSHLDLPFKMTMRKGKRTATNRSAVIHTKVKTKAYENVWGKENIALQRRSPGMPGKAGMASTALPIARIMKSS